MSEKDKSKKKTHDKAKDIAPDHAEGGESTELTNKEYTKELRKLQAELCIRHILDLIPYQEVPREKIELPERSMKHAYDDEASLIGRKFVPEYN